MKYFVQLHTDESVHYLVWNGVRCGVEETDCKYSYSHDAAEIVRDVALREYAENGNVLGIKVELEE